MPSVKNAWSLFLTFDLSIKLRFACSARCFNAKHSSGYTTDSYAGCIAFIIELGITILRVIVFILCIAVGPLYPSNG